MLLGDLSLRVGIHSGPVTAGVLRGDRARFQLFGDTMNTTARIESTGKAGRIHISQETADLIAKARKGHWLVKRKDPVQAKGKSDLQTYWIQEDDEAAAANRLEEDETDNFEVSNNGDDAMGLDLDIAGADRKERLIDWNVQALVRLIKQFPNGCQTLFGGGVSGTSLTVHGTALFIHFPKRKITTYNTTLKHEFIISDYDHQFLAF